MLRIADALEAIAENHTKLLNDDKYLSRRHKELKALNTLKKAYLKIESEKVGADSACSVF